jgi:hypothetical protein
MRNGARPRPPGGTRPSLRGTRPDPRGDSRGLANSFERFDWDSWYRVPNARAGLGKSIAKRSRDDAREAARWTLGSRRRARLRRCAHHGIFRLLGQRLPRVGPGPVVDAPRRRSSEAAGQASNRGRLPAGGLGGGAERLCPSAPADAPLPGGAVPPSRERPSSASPGDRPGPGGSSGPRPHRRSGGGLQRRRPAEDRSSLAGSSSAAAGSTPSGLRSRASYRWGRASTPSSPPR